MWRRSAVTALGAILINAFLFGNVWLGVLFIVLFLVSTLMVWLHTPTLATTIGWYLTFCGMALAFYYSRIFIYSPSLYDQSAEWFLLGAFASVVAGYAMACVGGGQRADLQTLRKIIPSSGDTRFISWAAVAGTVGFLLLAIEMIVVYGANLLDASALRSLWITRQVTLLGQLGNLLSVGSMVAAAALALCGKYLSRPCRWTCIAGSIAGAGYSILAGGRSTLLQVVIILFAALSIRQRADPLSRRARATLVLTMLSVAALYFAYIGIARNAEDVYAPKRAPFLMSLFKCQVNEGLATQFGNLPQFVQDAIVEGFLGMSSSIPFFHFHATYNIRDKTYGLYLVPLITRRVQIFFPIDSPEQILSAHAATGAGLNVFGYAWVTSVYALICEFGRLGALLFCFCFGFVCARCDRVFGQAPTFSTALLVVALSLVCAYFPFYFAIFDTPVFLLCVIAMVRVALSKRRGRLLGAESYKVRVVLHA